MYINVTYGYVIICLQETEPEKGESDVLGSPRSYQRQHPRPRHASSGNTMLDQLLSDMNNKFVTYVDEVSASIKKALSERPK